MCLAALHAPSTGNGAEVCGRPYSLRIASASNSGVVSMSDMRTPTPWRVAQRRADVDRSRPAHDFTHSEEFNTVVLEFLRD